MLNVSIAIRNRRPPPQSEQPLLTVDPKYLDFGEVWETDKFEWKIPITNISQQSVEIERFHSSCSCTIVKLKSLVLHPKETFNLPISIDLRRRDEVTSRDKMRVVAELRDPKTLQRLAPIEWMLSGARKRLVIKPSSIFLGSISQNESVTKTVKLEIAPGIVELTATSEGDVLVEIHKFDSKSSQAVVNLVVRKPILPGVSRGKVELTGKSQLGKTHKDTLPIEYIVTPDIAVEPCEVLFGSGDIGTTHVANVRLHSTTGKQIQIEAIEATGSGLSVVQLSDGSIQVTQQMTKLGSIENSLLLRVKGSDPIRIPVVYLGLQTRE